MFNKLYLQNGSNSMEFRGVSESMRDTKKNTCVSEVICSKLI